MIIPQGNNNIPKNVEKIINEDSVLSNSTSMSNSDIIQDISKIKNVYLFSKDTEPKIIEILTYLQSDLNLATNKIQVLKYIQNLLLKIEFNSEIFLRKFIVDKERLNLFHIIITQYVLYTNSGNKKQDEENYRSELRSLFNFLLSQVTLDKEIYHYILSFLIKFINQKNIINSARKCKKINNNDIQDEVSINLKSDNVFRVIELLQNIYMYTQSCQEISNYFFFSGNSDSHIIIPNKENPKDHNKKILNLDDTLCIMLFIKVLPQEYFKSVYPKVTFRLLELRFENKKNISINININNKITSSLTVDEELEELSDKYMNCVIIKFHKKKKSIIKEILLFKNFIGICSNIIIYKEKKSEELPKFLFQMEDKRQSLKDESIKQKLSLSQKMLFPNGIFKEELFSILTYADLSDNVENSILKQNIILNNDGKFNKNDFKDFIHNNLIAIYLPTRVENLNQYDDKPNSYKFILRDSINNLHANFSISTLPSLNGIHCYNEITKDFNVFGGINSLLPILELMITNEEFLTTDNFISFFRLISCYIFRPQHLAALMNDSSINDFFISLAYLLEKVPDKFFDTNLSDNFKAILVFLCGELKEKKFLNLFNQFYKYILLNRKILFKFNCNEQKGLIDQIAKIVKSMDIQIDVIQIIVILLSYDKERKYKFCCKIHADYFNEKYPIMEPELSEKIKSCESLLINYYNNLKKNQGRTNSQKNVTTGPKAKKYSYSSDEPQQIKSIKDIDILFWMLTLDLSPCLLKSVKNILEKCMTFYRKDEFLDIILYAYKNSFLDTKIDILIFLLNYLDNEKKFDLPSKKLKLILNEILPIFLLDNANDLLKEINTKNNNDDNNIEAQKDEDNELMSRFSGIKDIENVGNLDEGDNKDKNPMLLMQKSKTIVIKQSDKEEEQFGIRDKVQINDDTYELFRSNITQRKINKQFNKKKFEKIIFNYYEAIQINLNVENKYFDFKLDLLMKVVSNGNILLIQSFLKKILTIIEENKKIPDNFQKIINHKNLLHFILDISFQAYILNEKEIFEKKSFIPGFSLDLFKNNTDIPCDDGEKLIIIKDIYNQSIKILGEILKNNIFGLDFVLTWSRYFLELGVRNSIFNKIIDYIYLLLQEFISCKNITAFSEKSSLTSDKLKNTLYYLNILFEFCTFYRIKFGQSSEKKESSQSIYQIFQYIFYDKYIDGFDSFLFYNLSSYESKIKNYPFIRVIFSVVFPIWNGEKLAKNENDIYTKCIEGKKDIFINELSILFFSFEEYFLNKSSQFCNRGMPLIIIIFHYFINYFYIGGKYTEMEEDFKELRNYINILIISSSTLVCDESKKKKKAWPNDAQYKYIQDIIESILFKLIFFLYYKLKDLKRDKLTFEEKIKNENKVDNSKNFQISENITNIFKLYSINLAYFVKILNKIYTGVKNSEKEKKGKLFGIKLFSSKTEGVKKSAPYLFMDSLYKACPTLNLNEDINNELQKVSGGIDNMNSIIDEKEKIENINTKKGKSSPNIGSPENNNKTNKKNNQNEKNYFEELNKISFALEKDYKLKMKHEDNKKVENWIITFLNDSNIDKFYENNQNNHNEKLYPFFNYIEYRKNRMTNIIPYFDFTKNLKEYPYNLCLVPFYYPKIDIENTLNIEKIYRDFDKELKLNEKSEEIEQYFKCNTYKKIKKNMFKFNNIWSNEEFFYDSEKYKLKYKILNHLSNDFCRVLMTPISDMDYYLPKFSLFKGEMFRNNSENIIPITKTVDIGFFIKDEGELEKNVVEEPKENISNNNLKYTPLHELIKENSKKLKKNTENKKINDFNLISEYIEKEKNNKANDKHPLIAEACLIKSAFHIRGIIYINYKEICFYSFEKERKGNEEDFDKDKNICFGSIFKTQLHKYKHYFIKIPIKEIEYILKRRYYFKRNVLEIFYNQKSYLFRIDEKHFQEFLHYFQNFEQITIDFTKFEEKIGLVNTNNKLYEYNNTNIFFNSKCSSSIKYLYSKWAKWEISTFTLINLLNIYSSRSYNDLNQYPVFPWIITDYQSKKLPLLESGKELPSTQVLIRPFEKPMAMLDINEEAKERKDNYIEHWEAVSRDANRDENDDRYGSHYSTSLYLTYYLVRVFPFSYIRIELQGKTFDDPNRLFNSVSMSFICATTQKSDIRELIPEFFCLPEMFYNSNDLNLGEVVDNKTKKSVLVNNIEMPPWSNDDAYTFICKHREMLESPEVSAKINEWFNLIFGYRQKGPEGKKANNLFLKQTYEDFDEVHKKSKDMEKVYQKRIVEFGVTPSQIFKSKTDKRICLKDLRKKPLLMNIHINDSNIKLNIKDSEIYLDGEPYKIFSSKKRKEDKKEEKIIFLYQEKIKIISKKNGKILKKDKIKDKHKKDEDEKEKKENIDTPKDIEEKGYNVIDNHLEDECEIKEDENRNSIEKDEIDDYDKKIINPKYRMDARLAPTLIYDEGNYIALGGFWNGHILINKIIDEKNKKEKYQKNINIISTSKISPIIHMIIDSSETFVICANKVGTIYIYIIDNSEKDKWRLYQTIQNNDKEITCMDLNENLNIFITCDKGGYNNLYTFPNCKFFNSYKLNESIFSSVNSNNTTINNSSISGSNINMNVPVQLIVDYVIISNTPLPCIILYIKYKKCLCVFSINFHFLSATKINYDICPNGIKKYTDCFYKDYLFIYNSNENIIEIYNIIDLQPIIKTEKIKAEYIDLLFTKDMENALILVKQNEKDKEENGKEKPDKREYKILILESIGKTENK